MRLRTLVDVFACAATEGVELRIRWYRGPGPPAEGQPARQAGVRVRQQVGGLAVVDQPQAWSRWVWCPIVVASGMRWVPVNGSRTTFRAVRTV